MRIRHRNHPVQLNSSRFHVGLRTELCHLLVPEINHFANPLHTCLAISRPHFDSHLSSFLPSTHLSPLTSLISRRGRAFLLHLPSSLPREVTAAVALHVILLATLPSIPRILQQLHLQSPSP